jgi:hypothetical protein
MRCTGTPSSEIATLTREKELRTHKLRSLMEGEIKGECAVRAVLEPQIADLRAATQRLNAEIVRMNAQAAALNSQLDATRAGLAQKETALTVSRRVETAQLEKIADLTREGERLRCVLCAVLYCVVSRCIRLCMGERSFVLALKRACMYVFR